MKSKIFLLSPAHCGGKRASYLFNDQATFELARKIRTPAGATIGETFSFLSGLYFRGKLAYANHFGPGAYVITTDRGLVPVHRQITVDDLRAMGDVELHPDNESYCVPLKKSAKQLSRQLPADAQQVILLGSVASGKYVDILCEIFGSRLYFPSDFAGRGDMSRGALMLRAVRDNHELTYAPLALDCFRGVTASSSVSRRPNTSGERRR